MSATDGVSINANYTLSHCVGNTVVTGFPQISAGYRKPNDPSFDLDPELGKSINFDCFRPLVKASKAAGVERFIYASSGSVYGIKDEDQVTEDLTLEPISEYNKTKMVGERVLLSYADQMVVQIVRPATVCGVSSRMRLDVAVNMLTMQALAKGEITVLGGDQTRPNIHIEDITDLYVKLLEYPDERIDKKILPFGCNINAQSA